LGQSANPDRPVFRAYPGREADPARLARKGRRDLRGLKEEPEFRERPAYPAFRERGAYQGYQACQDSREKMGPRDHSDPKEIRDSRVTLELRVPLVRTDDLDRQVAKGNLAQREKWVWLDFLDQLEVTVNQEGRVYPDLLGLLENLAKMALRVSEGCQVKRDSKETRETMDHQEQQVLEAQMDKKAQLDCLEIGGYPVSLATLGPRVKKDLGVPRDLLGPLDLRAYPDLPG